MVWEVGYHTYRRKLAVGLECWVAAMGVAGVAPHVLVLDVGAAQGCCWGMRPGLHFKRNIGYILN